jgi:hypothetical protein
LTLRHDIALTRIEIDLHHLEQPIIKLMGRPIGISARVALNSDVVVGTRHITAEAKAFILAMLRDFSTMQPPAAATARLSPLSRKD